MRQLDTILRHTLPMGRIVTQQLPGCEDISLGLIDPDFPTGPLPAEVMRDVIAEPAYWAFCWGSGLGLARLVYDHPHWVAGKAVLDLGSGSGIAGIAAARNGARQVIACDSDSNALSASRNNAAVNGVSIELVDHLDAVGDPIDVVLLADVLYDKANLPLLDDLKARFQNILVADSRIHDIPDPAYRPIAEIEALTYPNLGEFDEFRTVRVFLYGSL